MNTSKIVNVLSVSGGKDSAAMWIYATKELGEKVVPVFADTGNEHPQTYEYLDYLEKELGPIKRVKADFSRQIKGKREYIEKHWFRKLTEDRPGQWKADKSVDPMTAPALTPDNPNQPEENGDWKWIPEKIGISPDEANSAIERALKALVPTGNPYLDLCLWKGRFPSTKARFCTQFLKAEVIQEQVYEPFIMEGYHIVSWQGVRADESPARAKLPEREEGEGFSTYRPLLHWTAAEVFAMHDKHNIEPNPLYKQGMSRVGCMPCINCNKSELFEIARRFPEEIARIAEWEKLVALASKHELATFFPTAINAGTGIHEVVEWSKTTHGGKQYDLFKAIESESVPSCTSIYGLCE